MLMMRTFLEENGRVCSAAMTDEQREEKNRKRRESYKRKKCYPNNKENEPGLHLLEWTCQSDLVHTNYFKLSRMNLVFKLLQLVIPMLPTPAILLSYMKITLV